MPPVLDPPAARPRVVLTYAPRGASRDAFARRDPELVLVGPAGTGKTRGSLEKLHLMAVRHPGMRGLMVRKTAASLAATALVTYTKRVLHPLDGVAFFGGSAKDPPQFRYPNGSALVIGGMDRPDKIMSSEYDAAYVNEATDLTLTDWESITTRLRNWVMPYQQLLGDCNPGAPTHWLKRRGDAGQATLLPSRHQDNPELYDAAGTPTERGAAYLAKLAALTGVRLLRLFGGQWAAAEGVVYEGWDEAVHRVDRDAVPPSWPRYWVVDFGYTNPFVWQAWAEDPDGRLVRYREIYMTGRLVEDHARTIMAVTAGEPRPVAVICDHDAEDRATLERHTGLATVAARKAVSPGLQAVQARLRPAGDGRPRVQYMRDALVERDPTLAEAGTPTCTEEEYDGYVWDTGLGRKQGEAPVKRDDHGMDTTRYMVAHLDLPGPSMQAVLLPPDALDGYRGL